MAVKRKARFGWTRSTLSIPFSIAAGTSAEEAVTDYIPGYSGVVERVNIAASMVAATGAGASRDISLVRTRGGVDTTMATATVVLANLDTKGEHVGLTLATSPADLEFVDDDTLSIMIAAGGTQFTAFTGVMLIRNRQQPQQAT